MTENIYDIISDYKQIERNVENIVEDVLSDENIPLLIRADILIKYKDDFNKNQGACTTIYQILDALSDPKLTNAKLKSLYKLLEMFINKRITKFYKFTYE